ncbi:MAG: cytochrome c [Pseudomonadota bacterium]
MLTTNPQRFVVTGLALALVIGGASSLVFAHGGAKGVVKERMDLMKDMADSMKVMGAMVKGETAFDPGLVAEKAGFLADHAPMIPDMTPEGSNDHPSEALPIIWQAWDDYVADADALAAEGAKLVEIATTGADEAAMRTQYVKLGKTCGTCHDRFRKPKE